MLTLPAEEVARLRDHFAAVVAQGERLQKAAVECQDEVQRVEWQKQRLMAQARERDQHQRPRHRLLPRLRTPSPTPVAIPSSQ